ncbi:MAG TPA: M23 family metallopeptidase [Thermodesulfobacteriota bacterium]|nr:M23 family metallopeptidase [Thermodesulfobacteriota bacterium]
MRGIKKFFYIIIIALVLGTIFYIIPQFEWHSPTVDIKLDTEYVGLRPFDVEIRDRGKGLKKVSIVLADQHGESPLFDKEYDSTVNEEKVQIKLDPKKLGIKGGPAEIRVMAEDRSRLKLFVGNKTTAVKKVTIDVTPPRIEVLSREHYINHGGSGLVIYKSSEDTAKSGVKVGNYFFPGKKGYFQDPEVYMAFFAYPYNLGADENIMVMAEDAAGNSRETSFFYRVKYVPYRKSTLDIGDDFIDRKMVPILGEEYSPGTALKEVFLKVNSDLRKKNDAQIKRIGEKSQGQILWNGAFHQLTNSKVEANFADARTYIYQGEEIDHQYHLGYDLAVTRRYPVEAANDGVVVFAGDLGIYGNAVIIDHGYGLNSLYGHLSTIEVNVGDMIQKKQIIGRTGETGLAAGDHLHYGVYIYGVPVRPVEWWDEKWINDNIMNKINEVKVEFGAGAKQTSTSAGNEPEKAKN